MPSGTFQPRQKQELPGVFIAFTNEGEQPLPDVRQGTLLSAFRADWGPLMVPTALASVPELHDLFGTNLGASLPEQNLRGGAELVWGIRVGTAGTAAQVVLLDSLGATVATLPMKYVGGRPNASGGAWSVTIRVSPTRAGYKEAVLYEGASALQTVEFVAAGGDEAGALVAAINASASAWFGTAVKNATGSGVVATVANKPVAGGVDPTVVSADYATALGLGEAKVFNIVTVDSELPAVHASVQSFVDRLVDSGKYVMGVVSEDATVVTWATRKTDALAFNDENMVYLGVGFYLADGTHQQGYRAAGRVAGVIAAAPYTDGITNLQIPGAVLIDDELTTTELREAKASGMLTLRYNASGQVVVTQGINTLVTPPANKDAGWKKIRRARQRYRFTVRATLATEPMVGRLTNDDAGQSIVLSAIRRVVTQMIGEGAIRALPAPVVEADPNLQPTAGPDDFYTRTGFVDNDSMEFIYHTIATKLSAAA
jgi:hypothetical protein